MIFYSKSIAMRSPKYILLFVILIITLLFNLFLLVRQRKYNNVLKEDFKYRELFDAKREKALLFLSYYNKINNIRILDTIDVKFNNGQQINIKGIIENENKLVIWFSVNSCANCYKRELEQLRSLVDEIGKKKIIYLASGFTSNRAFYSFMEEQNIKENVFYIGNKFLTDNILTKDFIPFLFITDSSLQVRNIFLIDKLLPDELTVNYLETIKDKYFKTAS